MFILLQPTPVVLFGELSRKIDPSLVSHHKLTYAEVLHTFPEEQAADVLGTVDSAQFVLLSHPDGGHISHHQVLTQDTVDSGLGNVQVIC